MESQPVQLAGHHFLRPCFLAHGAARRDEALKERERRVSLRPDRVVDDGPAARRRVRPNPSLLGIED